MLRATLFRDKRQRDPLSGKVKSTVPRELQRAQRILMVGFLLIIGLLALDGLVGFRGIVSTRGQVSLLLEGQFHRVELIDAVQRSQSSLSSLLLLSSTDGKDLDRQHLESGVHQIKATLRSLFESVPKNDPDLEIWRQVLAASESVAQEAHAVLQLPPGANPNMGKLLEARDGLVASTAKLIRANHGRAEAVKQQVDQVTTQQLMQDAVLLTLGVLMALVCAALITRLSARLYAQIAQRDEELGVVSWQLLEKQEHLARRLSHELHDELGQGLTALKAQLARHAAAGCSDPKWMADCQEILRDSIRSAHEISQLLRPTILDDFGLDSALGWLCERFEERYRVQVHYRSGFHRRLEPQAETHLFRIAQEALTNVARHSCATLVEVVLRQDGDQAELRIVDNGKGLAVAGGPGGQHYGIVGMKARARSLDGELSIDSEEGAGTSIYVRFPWRAREHCEADPYPVG